jgi:hypothetical protein
MTTASTDDIKAIDAITQFFTTAYSCKKMSKPDLTISEFFTDIQTPLSDAEIDSLVERCSVDLDELSTVGVDDYCLEDLFNELGSDQQTLQKLEPQEGELEAMLAQLKQ